MNHCRSGLWILTASFLIVDSSTVLAGNWPQWRGPDNDCISKEKNLPTEWSETKNVVWKLKLPGMGSGTPAVWGDHIFLTADDGKNLFALCINTKGDELWRNKVGVSGGKKYHGDSNDASPSPSTDGKHAYFFFAAVARRSALSAIAQPQRRQRCRAGQG